MIFCDVDGAAAPESPMAYGATQDKLFVSLVSVPVLGLRACLALVSLSGPLGSQRTNLGLRRTNLESVLPLSLSRASEIGSPELPIFWTNLKIDQKKGLLIHHRPIRKPKRV